MKIIKEVKKKMKGLKNPYNFRGKIYFRKYYNKGKIQQNTVLFQSYGGTSISGSVYYMLLELCTNSKYQYLKKYVVATKGAYNQIKKKLISLNFDDVEVVEINTKKYCKLLATAEYLLNNSTFPAYFIKRDGQKYLNTWHGTPLKTLGRSIADAPNEIGNTQRNFIMSDYLLYPNEFTFEHIRRDYMLDNFFNGKYIIAGYPRNSVFFNEFQYDRVRGYLDIGDKKVAVYMPTWRGNNKEKKTAKQSTYIMHTLYELDKRLNEDTILYVKFHSLTNLKINYKEFKHIRKMPGEFETYEFLNIADCLITDYSSVFFDYANTKKKIILYGYDKDEYLSDKGMYLDYEKLPFTSVDNVYELAKEINDIDKYENYSKFNKKYTYYDCKDASKNLCELVFENKIAKNMKVIEGSKYHSNKPNVLIFGGGLDKNGITTAVKALFSGLDNKKYNFILTFYSGHVERNKHVIHSFYPFDYIPLQGKIVFNVFELICYGLYFYFKIGGPIMEKVIKNIYKREIERLYPGIKFEYVIHFSGYETRIMKLFEYMNAKRLIYIHNDMRKEEKAGRVNFPKAYKRALRKYDGIVCIRDTSKDEIIKYCPGINEEKVKVAHNLNNIDEIISKSQEEISFENDTYCNVSIDMLNQILDDDNNEIITTIGRFSPEKGHKRLINAFYEYSKSYPNSYLIIIGGKGVDFGKEREYIESLNTDKIIIIRSISNPYTILNKSDLFIQSSFYEGLPMVIMEALILKKPVMSTDISGPRELLNKGYGHLVENSEKGILKGLYDFREGNLKETKEFDAKAFNEHALKEFYNLFK